MNDASRDETPIDPTNEATELDEVWAGFPDDLMTYRPMCLTPASARSEVGIQ